MRGLVVNGDVKPREPDRTRSLGCKGAGATSRAQSKWNFAYPSELAERLATAEEPSILPLARMDDLQVGETAEVRIERDDAANIVLSHQGGEVTVMDEIA